MRLNGGVRRILIVLFKGHDPATEPKLQELEQEFKIDRARQDWDRFNGRG